MMVHDFADAEAKPKRPREVVVSVGEQLFGDQRIEVALTVDGVDVFFSPIEALETGNALIRHGNRALIMENNDE